MVGMDRFCQPTLSGERSGEKKWRDGAISNKDDGIEILNGTIQNLRGGVFQATPDSCSVFRAKITPTCMEPTSMIVLQERTLAFFVEIDVKQHFSVTSLPVVKEKNIFCTCAQKRFKN